MSCGPNRRSFMTAVGAATITTALTPRLTHLVERLSAAMVDVPLAARRRLATVSGTSFSSAQSMVV
jgi:hypothetical protein